MHHESMWHALGGILHESARLPAMEKGSVELLSSAANFDYPIFVWIWLLSWTFASLLFNLIPLEPAPPLPARQGRRNLKEASSSYDPSESVITSNISVDDEPLPCDEHQAIPELTKTDQKRHTTMKTQVWKKLIRTMKQYLNLEIGCRRYKRHCSSPWEV